MNQKQNKTEKKIDFFSQMDHYQKRSVERVAPESRPKKFCIESEDVFARIVCDCDSTLE